MIQTLATSECVNLTKPEGQRNNFPGVCGGSGAADRELELRHRAQGMPLEVKRRFAALLARRSPKGDWIWSTASAYSARWEWAAQTDGRAGRRARELVAGRTELIFSSVRRSTNTQTGMACLVDSSSKHTTAWLNWESISSAIAITPCSNTLKSMFGRFSCKVSKMLTCNIRDSSTNIAAV